jgi:hypothetical protein
MQGKCTQDDRNDAANMSGRKRHPIPAHLRAQVDQIVADFNQQTITKPACFYVPRYRGHSLYLDRHNSGPIGPIARLQYQGKIDTWGGAIYKDSRERYDPEAWFFPGAGQVDGTMQGAMQAGLEAYPLSDYNNTSVLGRVLSFLFGSRR